MQLDLFGNPIEAPRSDAAKEVVPCIFDESVTMQARLINGEWWFRAKEPCLALGLGNVGMALTRIPDDEKMTISTTDSQTGRGGARSHSYISEPGLYRLVLGAETFKGDPVRYKPNVERFQHWVLHEVLPSLRKTGTYSMPQSRVERERRPGSWIGLAVAPIASSRPASEACSVRLDQRSDVGIVGRTVTLLEVHLVAGTQLVIRVVG